jgi:Bacteriophage HK97-gp10, putative tail-component
VSVRVLLEGNNELRAALGSLTEELNQEARAIVHEAAQQTASQLRSVYPRGRTGAMQRGVKVTTRDTTTTTSAKVRSTTDEATYWEYGTQVRRTNAGFNRGAMPAATGHGLISLASRNRRQMLDDLVALVRSAGFTVTVTP